LKDLSSAQRPYDQQSYPEFHQIEHPRRVDWFV
jgi:hypothetical protein